MSGMSDYLNSNGLTHFWNAIKDRTIANPFYDEITVVKGREQDTDYYLAYVPKFDSDGNIINLTVSYNPQDNPLVHAGKTGTTLSINGNSTISMRDNTFKAGITIGDGVVLNSYSFYNSDELVETPLIYEKYIGIKSDRSVVDYNMNSDVTPQQMLDDGCLNVFSGYYKMVDNGVMVDLDTINPPVAWNGSGPLTSESKGMVMFMGVMPNDDLYFLTSDGRTDFNPGLGYVTAAEILMNLGCTNVYYLDGGGSSAMVLKGSKINRNWDGNQTEVRNIHWTLDFKKPSKNTIIQRVFEQVGIEKQRIIEQLIPYINNANKLWSKGTLISNGSDLDNIVTPGKYYTPSGTSASTLINAPLTSRGFSLIVSQIGQYDDGIIQFVISNSPHVFYYRTFRPSNEGSTNRPWNKAFASGPMNFVVTPNASQDIHIQMSTPYLQIIWAFGTAVRGLDFVYYANGSLHTVHVVPTNDDTVGSPEYSFADNVLTIANHSSVTLRGVIVIG